MSLTNQPLARRAVALAQCVCLAVVFAASFGCGVLPSLGQSDPCYYMSDEEHAASVAFFGQASQFIGRDAWIAINGHPCDAFPDLDVPSRVPHETCMRCTESIFDAVGWE